MNKIVSVYQNSKQILEGIYNVHIDKMDIVPNYSVSQILSSAINYVEISAVPQLLQIMCRKLKVEASCVIDILNFKAICSAYTSGSMDDATIFALLNGRTNIISMPSIKKIIDQDQNLTITGIDNSKFITSIKIERVKL
jgi:hypothetical protein